MEDRASKYLKQSSPVTTSERKLTLQFDIVELDLICSYVASENRAITRSGLNNVSKVINMLNMHEYQNNPEALRKIEFIKKGIIARLEKNLQSKPLIIKDIMGGMGNGMIEIREIDTSEIEWVNQNMTGILKSSYMKVDADKFMGLFSKIKTTKFGATDTVQELESAITQLHNQMRRARVETTDSVVFSLGQDRCYDVLRETWRHVTSPSNVLTFGTQAFNLLFGGGLQSARVYVFLGLPGERKSSTLLELAIQIKKYNKGYKCADPTKKPCIVLFSMENSVLETVERMYSMLTLRQLKDEFNEEDVIKQFKQSGFHVSNDDPIDLFILFRPNMSEDTSYMYDIIDNLYDEGYEVMCMFQDYAMRIKAADQASNKEMRFQLGAVINEFKTLATLKNIPVVTASQLNREATSNIDNARIKNKSDLVRLLGRANVSESTMIINNSDWVALIAPEMTADRETYLGIQRVKSRYYIPAGNECFFIPYIGTSLKLVEDVHLPKPLHRTSMTDDESIMAGFNSGTTPIYGINGVHTMVQVDDNTMVTDPQTNVFLNASGHAARLIQPELMLGRKPQQMCHTVKQQLYHLVEKG